MRALACFIVVLFAAAAPARADVFTVAGVPVSAEAENAVAARDRALAQGQLTAARLLFQRLTLPEDRAAIPPIDAAQAQLMVSGLEIDDETARGTIYRGVVTVSFDPSQARGYLRAAGVPFVDSPTRPTLVVPVLRFDGEPRLWENNPWAEAWRDARLEHGIAPVILPTGDLADIRAVRAPSAEAVNVDSLSALAANYGAERVLVATATPRGDGASGAVVRLTRLDLINGSVNSLGRFQADGFEALIAGSVQLLEEEWKRVAIVRGGTVSRLPLTVLYGSVDEWVRLRDTLGGASLITDARLDALANSGAAMTVSHRGRPDQLAAELAERGVALFDEPGLGWVARLGAAPQPYVSPLPPPR